MDDAAASLTPAEASLEATRRAMWRWVAAMVGFVVAAAIVGGMLFKVPYVALVPGSARDTEPLVSVDGLEEYPSEGELLLTTVRIRQRPNLWEYLWLRADDDAEIVPEEVILGGRTPDENREFNLQLMSDSKAEAVAVALEALGYDAITTDGVRIVELVEGGAAEDVIGLGDTIVAIDGEPVSTAAELVDVLGAYGPGDEITLLVETLDAELSAAQAEADAAEAAAEADDNDESDDDAAAGAAAEVAEIEPEVVELAITLGPKPDDPDAAFLGVAPTDRYQLASGFDFDISIDSGAVGGPSAGLAFTLAVLDQLTEGELTGGSTVAVTGTIDVTGRVGNVGGVVQKTAAVRDLGADVFLVPAGLPSSELDRVMERAGDDLEIIPVEDLDDALAALADLGGEVAAVEEFAANLS